jgi:serine/threonine protein kinase/ADP-ribose pyrophosphatase YjhB (NUDIX family)
MALNLKTETVLTGDGRGEQCTLPAEEIAPHFTQLEIIECLGRGGMGVVYKARQKTLNRLVALKLLAPERVKDPKFADRFAREAQALAALNHPNIVTVHDFGQAGGFYFLLMEFVDGANLRELLRAQKFTPEQALTIVPPLCDALQFAHEHGIVHRDIKPENILLDKSGRVKVADFGIAKMLGSEHGASTGEPLPDQGQTQSALGTPGYIAPEQKTEPQRVDNRADIYSLGVVFYEMLTGELPGKRIEVPSKKVQVDVRLDQIVMRALEKQPELRWQTAAEMRTQVETIAATPFEAGRSRRRARRALIGVACVLFLAFAAIAVVRNFRPETPPETQAPQSESLVLESVPHKDVRELLRGIEQSVKLLQAAVPINGLLHEANVLDAINEYCDELQGKNRNAAFNMEAWGVSDPEQFARILALIAGLENDAEGMRSIAVSNDQSRDERVALLNHVWKNQFMPAYTQLAALLAANTPSAAAPGRRAHDPQVKEPTAEEVRNRSVDEWLKRLGRDAEFNDPPFTALQALVRKAKESTNIKEEIIRKAIAVTDDPVENDFRRWQSCYVLSGIGDKRGIPAIARTLKHENETVRGVAACALGQFDDADARAALEAAAKTEKSSRVQQDIQKALRGEFRQKE